MRINENYKKIEMRRHHGSRIRRKKGNSRQDEMGIASPEVFGGEKTGLMRLKYQKILIDQVFSEEIKVQK